MLAAARATLRRLTPAEPHAAMRDGAHLVDIHSDSQRVADGTIPGAAFVPRNVLEWRLDPACSYRDDWLTTGNGLLVLICDEGYQSSLAAASVQRFGQRPITDVIGGFRAWCAAGLPVERDVNSMTSSRAQGGCGKGGRSPARGDVGRRNQA